jgi:hypothetical protein
MSITLHHAEHGRMPLCSAIIVQHGACNIAGPFFVSDAPVPMPTGLLQQNQKRSIRMLRKETASGGRVKTVSRRQVVSRLWRTAERQVAEIETRMGSIESDHQALEREAKTLAIIAKTVRDLVAIDTEATASAVRNKSKGAGAAHGKANVPAGSPEGLDAEAGEPRDIEEFRAELARRLDELRRERRGDEAS